VILGSRCEHPIYFGLAFPFSGPEQRAAMKIQKGLLKVYADRAFDSINV
jgi:hypothetical protein